MCFYCANRWPWFMKHPRLSSSFRRTTCDNLEYCLSKAAAERAGEVADLPHFYSFRGFSCASKMPSLTSSSGFGLCWIFCSRLSARMCFSRLLWFAWRAGSAFELARMLPVSLLNSVSINRNGRPTLHQLVTFRASLEILSETVGSLLALQCELRCLQRADSSQ